MRWGINILSIVFWLAGWQQLGAQQVAQRVYFLDGSRVNTAVESGYFKMGHPGLGDRKLEVRQPVSDDRRGAADPGDGGVAVFADAAGAVRKMRS